MNVVDVNVTTSKITEEHLFKDRKLREKNSDVNEKKEDWLKESMVETIQ
jgi:hypothetical protein